VLRDGTSLTVRASSIGNEAGFSSEPWIMLAVMDFRVEIRHGTQCSECAHWRTRPTRCKHWPTDPAGPSSPRKWNAVPYQKPCLESKEMTVTDGLESSMFVTVLNTVIMDARVETVGRNATWSDKDTVFSMILVRTGCILACVSRMSGFDYRNRQARRWLPFVRDR